jgi:hypothetical protein
MVDGKVALEAKLRGGSGSLALTIRLHNTA